ncbi:MAG TPA: tetratricopeptide repeat-containing diguanylate cyclase [Arenimonas sp.]|nr:tetratricopeptide repeat-containing diguanylate cyclase [Arenimonas sp.]
MTRQPFLVPLLLLTALGVAPCCAATASPAPAVIAAETEASAASDGQPLPSDSGAQFDARFKEIDSSSFEIDDAEHAQRLLEELRSLLPPGDAARERLYSTMQCALSFDNDNAGGLAFAEEKLQLALAAEDHAVASRLYYCKGGYQSALGASDDELVSYEAGIAEALKAGDSVLAAFGVAFRGAVHSIRGEQARALIDFLDAQERFRQAGEDIDAEGMLFDIAVAYRRMELFDKAEQYLTEIEAKARAEDDKSTLVGVLFQLGFLHEERGELELAEASFKQALELSRQQDDRGSIGSARLALAGVYVQTDRHSSALGALRRAGADFAATSNQSNDGLLALYTGQARAGLGQHREALQAFAEAEAALKAEGNLRYQALLYHARSHSHEAMKDHAAANADLKQYISVRQQLGENMRTEQTLLLQHQFDTARRDLENQRLTAEKALREQEVAALVKTRRWQWAAIVMGAVLMVVLSVLAVRQVLRLRRLQVLALTDSLTGVGNRRRIERYANEQISESLAQKRTFTVLTVDVDYFKRINDTYGHGAGDQVLVRVAQTCEAALREFDQIGRTGGEEFLIVLPRTQLAQAVQVAERLRSNVAKLDLEDLTPGLKPSISIGVAEFKSEDRELKELMRRADNALYRAKANGRDRVEVEA